ncbi:MAG: hypothetical protein ACK46X_01175 [Candidatus Sericytochromatia bacterium]
MRRILSIACVLWLTGCSGPTFVKGATLVVTPEPSQLVVAAPTLHSAATEADYPTIGIVFSRYPRDSSSATTFRTYSIQYFNMANTGIPMTDVPQRSFPTPITVAPPAPDVPSTARFQLSLLSPAVVTYLKNLQPPVTINARVTVNGERGPGEPVQYTFNVPIQVLASPATPAP